MKKFIQTRQTYLHFTFLVNVTKTEADFCMFSHKSANIKTHFYLSFIRKISRDICEHKAFKQTQTTMIKLK